MSGPGSNINNTRVVSSILPGVIKRYDIATLLDLPCGDFAWMRDVDLGSVEYIGADIVADLVAANSRRYATPRRRFVQMNLVNDDLPDVDLIMVRDCLIHLPNDMVQAALVNIARSNIRYALVTNHPGASSNLDIELGKFRPVDLCRPPFNLPEPIEFFDEAQEHGKGLGLWRIDQLRDVVGKL